MAAFLATHQRHWDASVAGHNAAGNPASGAYSGKMVDPANAHIWAWDARPYPNFPDDLNTWSDGGNWHLGHWLNGRLGGARLADLIEEILENHNFKNFDISQVYGQIDGYIIGENSSARTALEPLINLFRLTVVEDGDKIIFRSPGIETVSALSTDNLASVSESPLLIEGRSQETELANEAIVQHIDPATAYNGTSSSSRRLEGASQRQITFGLPAIMAQEVAVPAADLWLQSAWTARDTIQFTLPLEHAYLQVGDQISIASIGAQKIWQVSRIEEAEALTVEARAIERTGQSAAVATVRGSATPAIIQSHKPFARLLDLPIMSGSDPLKASRVVAAADPWPGEMAVLASPINDGFSLRQLLGLNGSVGHLTAVLSGDVTARWDFQTQLSVKMLTGSLSSLPEELVLNGANLAAVRSSLGGWELLQFQSAELVATDTWTLSGLLRGQLGSELEMQAGANIDADFVLINQATPALEYSEAEIGIPLQWRVGPANQSISAENFVANEFAPGLRGLTPYSPAHLRSDSSAIGDLSLTWIRRDRLNADAWGLNDIPMSELLERYQVNVTSMGIVLRTWETSSNQTNYSLADQQSDLLLATGELNIEVSQISDIVGPGTPAKIGLGI